MQTKTQQRCLLAIDHNDFKDAQDPLCNYNLTLLGALQMAGDVAFFLFESMQYFLLKLEMQNLVSFTIIGTQILSISIKDRLNPPTHTKSHHSELEFKPTRF